MIRGAFIELYKGLGFLKTYRNLNMLAFVKILKKFDKVTNKQFLPIYLRVVESSYFDSSDKAMKLVDEVEEIFINNFAEDDKRKAMKYLKPTQREESHGVTFFIGLSLDVSLHCLLDMSSWLILLECIGHNLIVYMETVYPVLSMFSLLFLQFFLYGCNIFLWRKPCINYTFIFELSPTKDLKYRDVFLICTASMAAVMGVLFVNLSLVAKGYPYAQVQAIPALLLLVFLLLLVYPFNIFYKSSRHRFLRVIRNIILSPLYKCWRAMQCARRWFDEGQTSHLVNLGKYVSAMLAAGAKVVYEKERNVGWLCLLVIMSSGATVYQLYWDFVKDWGLLQFHSKNPWLRNELMLKRKFIYFFSMGLNLILRLAWLQTVVHYSFGSVDYRVTELVLAALEVIRRGQWNFYRLENEHLTNAGKFRAVKTVPLPFYEVDDQD